MKKVPIRTALEISLLGSWQFHGHVKFLEVVTKRLLLLAAPFDHVPKIYIYSKNYLVLAKNSLELLVGISIFIDGSKKNLVQSQSPRTIRPLRLCISLPDAPTLLPVYNTSLLYEY